MAEGKLLYITGTVPMFGAAYIGNWWLIPSGVFAVLWLGFHLWRFWVMAKTGYVGYVPDKQKPHPIIDGIAPTLKDKSPPDGS